MFRNNTFILSIFLSCASASIQHFSDNVVEFPTKCIQAIVKQNFPCKSRISIVSTETCNDGIDTFIQTLNQDLCYNIITREFQDLKDDPIFNINDLFIISSKDILDFNDNIPELLKDALWNHNAKFIIYINEIYSINELFQTIIKNKMYNVIIISAKHSSEATVYTYYPFANQSCGRKLNDVVKLGSCDDNDVRAKAFKDKIPTERGKYKGCTLVVAVRNEMPFTIDKSSNIGLDGSHIDGVEQYILHEIAVTESLTIKYITHPRSNRTTILRNGINSGVLHYLLNRTADIAGGGLVITLARAKEYDFIYGIGYGSFLMFTAAPPESNWKIVYKEFGVSTWALICLIFVVVATIFSINDTMQSRVTIDRTALVLKLWGYFFFNTNQLWSKQKHIRKILIWWIAFTFYISSFYITGFCSLTTSQIRPRNNYHIGYPPDKYTLCSSQGNQQIFKERYNISLILSNVTSCETADEKFAAIIANPKLSTIESDNTYEFMKHRFIDDDGNEKIDIWDFSTLTTMKAFYINRGFHLKDFIGTRINRMQETGLIKSQLNKIYMKSQMAYKSKRKQLKTFGIKDMRVALIILFVGDILALVVFIVEVSKKNQK